VLLVGAVYLAAGIGFGALAAGSASHQMRLTWRLAAWLASAAAFTAHVAYEHFRRRNPPRATAWHTALAVALGAFALAAAANVHSLWVPSSNRLGLALALVVWPVLAAVPAFLAALAASVGLARTRWSS